MSHDFGLVLSEACVCGLVTHHSFEPFQSKSGILVDNVEGGPIICRVSNNAPLAFGVSRSF